MYIYTNDKVMYMNYYNAGSDALLEPGVYTMEDLRIFGRKQRWCPYFLARHMLAFANVVVYNYQYMLDPKVLLIPSHARKRKKQLHLSTLS